MGSGERGRGRPAGVPDGFRTYVMSHGVKETRAHFHMGADRFRVCCEALGIADRITKRRGNLSRLPRPMPADFARNAVVETNEELEKRYHAGPNLVTRWRRQSGVIRETPRRGGGVPDDWPRLAPTRYASELAVIFRTSPSTIARWSAKTGISPKKGRVPMTPMAVPQIDPGVTAQAAHHLRRFFPNVYRADILPLRERRALPRQGVGLIVVAGRGALSAAEIVKLAVSHGFKLAG